MRGSQDHQPRDHFSNLLAQFPALYSVHALSTSWSADPKALSTECSENLKHLTALCTECSAPPTPLSTQCCAGSGHLVLTGVVPEHWHRSVLVPRALAPRCQSAVCTAPGFGRKKMVSFSREAARARASAASSASTSGAASRPHERARQSGRRRSSGALIPDGDRRRLAR